MKYPCTLYFIILFLNVLYDFHDIFPGRPSAPVGLCVTKILQNEVHITWDRPDTDGGMPITGYVIERREASRGSWSTAGVVNASTTRFNIQKLLEGNEYYFRVLAENQVGTGDAIETTQPVAVKSPYSKSYFIHTIQFFSCKVHLYMYIYSSM